MSARPPRGERLFPLEALADPGSRGVVGRAGDELFRAFVVRRGGEVFGYLDRCPHADFPLAFDGERFLTRAGDLILCSGHGALFRIEDGACVAGPCAGRRLEPFAVGVRDGAVVVL